MSSKNSRKLRTRRRYSEGFKRARVEDFESGTFSVQQIKRLYAVPPNTLYRWIKKYTRFPKNNTAVIVEVPNSQTEKVKQLEQQIAELQQALGRKQIQLDYYEALLAELRQQGVDVGKKNGATRPSTDSANPPQHP